MADFMLIFVAVALLILTFLDISTTLAFEKAAKGFEGNPVEAWLQAQFPKGWPYIKAAVTLSLAVLALCLLPAQIATISLFALDTLYLVVVLNNYQIVKGL